MKNNKNSTKTFESVVKQLVKKLGMEEEYQFAILKEEWKEIIGDRIAAITNIISLKDGKLLVETNSSTCRVELIMRTEEIRKAINTHFATELVHTIVFK